MSVEVQNHSPSGSRRGTTAIWILVLLCLVHVASEPVVYYCCGRGWIPASNEASDFLIWFYWPEGALRENGQGFAPIDAYIEFLRSAVQWGMRDQAHAISSP